jgi:hypothetical protein
LGLLISNCPYHSLKIHLTVSLKVSHLFNLYFFFPSSLESLLINLLLQGFDLIVLGIGMHISFVSYGMAKEIAVLLWTCLGRWSCLEFYYLPCLLLSLACVSVPETGHRVLRFTFSLVLLPFTNNQKKFPKRTGTAF